MVVSPFFTYWAKLPSFSLFSYFLSTEPRENLSEVKNILVDAGYTGKIFATQTKDIIGASVEVIKRSALHSFVVLPKRWVIERSFAWLEKRGRL
ncbi:DDE_Tnp_1 domain-containing protein [Trichonephila clavata]|uniref:DDE_Tnp_1 domain-containing protein n=1 Tax=Trichonephila clavata TaxID=2740835 RepID=A0A8X6M517_TRICU|nr:DDE_Tnp_1 domain-containing protein [Trichonephila clavata]